uniref:Peptidase n=1 Tax=Streptococcus hyointestinalis TaxID=1337 RepID=A0A0E3SZE1_9STRE|nr:peptidase [Streptococcus hyointestinalis]
MGNNVKKFLCLLCMFFTFSITPIVYGEDISLSVDKNEVTTQVSVSSSDEYQSGDATPQNQYDVTKSSDSYDNHVGSQSYIDNSNKSDTAEDTINSSYVEDSSIVSEQESGESKEVDSQENFQSDQVQTKETTADGNTNNLSASHIFWDKQWDIKNVTNNGESYELYQASKNTTIAIVDTGIMTEHPDLAFSLGDYLKNFVPEGGFDGSEAYEQGNVADVTDFQGHGTEVAGQITANGNMLGVAPGITINIYRVFGESYAKPEWIAEAVKQAADDGNRVITISSGQYLMITGSYEDGTNDYQDYLIYKEAVDYATSKGSIVVAALGNEGLNIQDNQALVDYVSTYRNIKVPGVVVDAPSVFDNVVAVGGIDYYNNLSDFSNYSSAAIYAPAGTTANLVKYGEEAFTNQGFYLTDWIFTTSYTGWYQYVYGNSFAAPKVAGALALVADKYNITDVKQLKEYLISHSPEINSLKILNIVDLLSEDIKTVYTEIIYKKALIESRVEVSLEVLNMSKKFNDVTPDNYIAKYNSKNSENNKINDRGVVSLRSCETLPNTGANRDVTYEVLGLFLLAISTSWKKKMKTE